MGRIFWQFFAAIWLTMIGAIAFIVIANSYLKVLPPKGPMLETQRRQAFETVSLLLIQGEATAARAYVGALAQLREPTVVKITSMPEHADPTACRSEGRTVRLIFDAKNQLCYRVEVVEPSLSLLETYTPTVLPPLAVFLTSVISTFLLTRYLARPVIALRSGLSALAGGNFAVRIGFRQGWWNDGVTKLGHDFDVTAGKLEALQENQKQLFHDVSHELRSPLSRMQAALGLIKRSPAKLDAILPRMDREIERLDGLVEQILTLARLRTPETSIIERQTVDIIDLVTVIVDNAAFEAETRNIRIDFEGEESFVTEVNGELIYRAVENVMRNAVKYSTGGGVISVRMKSRGSGALDIVISNSGMFVPPENVDRLFDPFTRLNESGMVSGHGLGLAITRRAVETHGGRVWAESNPGGGLTVGLQLPRNQKNQAS